MGYRLHVFDPEHQLEFYGTKLYGYVDHYSLESFKYLKSIGKVDDDTIFSDCFDNKFKLTPEQFKTFIDLYGRDFLDYAGFELRETLDYNALEEMLTTSSDKIISWW